MMSALDDIITRYQDAGGILANTLPNSARAELAQLRAEQWKQSEVDAMLKLRVELAQLRADVVALQEANTALEPYSKLAVVLNASSAADVIGAVDALYSELAALREENLRLGSGEYLLREIGAALNCPPDATILQRSADQARRITALEAVVNNARDQFGIIQQRARDNGDLITWHMAEHWLAANAPAPQAKQEQTA